MHHDYSKEDSALLYVGPSNDFLSIVTTAELLAALQAPEMALKELAAL